MSVGKYINPFTDFGFKRLFGEEANKDILMDFLSELLREEQGEIKDITFKKNEQFGVVASDRRAIFDIYCENEKGEKFIVEMQKAKHDFFKDRSVFYSTFPIREQAERGDWNYKLKAVYTIAILDFVFEEDKDDIDKMLYRVKLSDIETHKVFYNKLSFVYIEMPKFSKTLDQCNSHFERWLYVLRNLEKLDSYPEKLQDKIFEKLFGEASIASLTPEDLEAYDQSLKEYWDLQGVVETAQSEGISKGHVLGFQDGVASMNEKVERVEKEKQRVEKEKQRVEKEKQRVEKEKQKLFELLKSMGLSDSEIQERLGN